MTPAEFTAALASLGVTCAEIAPVLGYSSRQMYRYASGRAPIPPLVDWKLRHEIEICMVRPYTLTGGVTKWQGFRRGLPIGPLVETKRMAQGFALDLPR